MKLDFDIRWLIADSEEELDQRLLQLLKKINETGSLQTAAKELSLSYRTAWGIMRNWNEAFHTPLCVLERGRGTKLTPIGQKLLQTKSTIDSEYSGELQETASHLNNEIVELVGKRKQKLIAYTSHDLAIGFLQTLCEKSLQLDIDFHFQGSLDNLKLLNSSKSNIAGFHFPADPVSKSLISSYSKWLSDEKHILVQLAIREQGLMLSPSLVDHVTSLHGLTRRSVKFINRQKGSGTRAIFDELIKHEGINKKDINGYNTEEFTHTAVAALINCGAANVGFGLKAAAKKFKLKFIPVFKETYVIAIDKSLPDNVTDTFIKLIKSRELRIKINKLTGYSGMNTGKFLKSSEILNR